MTNKDLNLLLIEKFGELEQICNQTYDATHGVSVYIEKMDNSNYLDREEVPNWEYFFKKLKEIRHKRNKISHGEIAFTDVCASMEDLNFIIEFKKRILTKTDPLSILKKVEEERKSLSNKAPSNKAAFDKPSSSQATSNKNALNIALSNKPTSDKTSSNKSIYDKAPSSKATSNKTNQKEEKTPSTPSYINIPLKKKRKPVRTYVPKNHQEEKSVSKENITPSKNAEKQKKALEKASSKKTNTKKSDSQQITKKTKTTETKKNTVKNNPHLTRPSENQSLSVYSSSSKNTASKKSSSTKKSSHKKNSKKRTKKSKAQIYEDIFYSLAVFFVLAVIIFTIIIFVLKTR